MALHGIAATEVAQTRLSSGAAQLALDELGAASGLEPGRPLRLLDRFGETLACGVVDPENEVVHVWSRTLVRGFDAGFFRSRVQAALALRRHLGLVDGISAYRLLNGDGDALSGVWVDVYGPYLVVQVASRALLPFARLVAEAALATSGEPALGVRGAVLKVRGKDPQDKSHKDEVLGERPPAKLVVQELGVPYEVHLLGSLNVGLFTDMREHRRGIARFTAGRRVLNTFAYTGALSVAAARAGATAVTSVDLSGGVLSWARENFRLSSLPVDDEKFRFETSDVRKFMEREQDRGATYDMIILDPPTVSGARAALWSMKRDYPDLIALATRLLPADGGFLWISANARKGPNVLKHVEEGLKRASREAAILELGGLPPDYPTPLGSSDGRYLEVCQLFVRGV